MANSEFGSERRRLFAIGNPPFFQPYRLSNSTTRGWFRSIWSERRSIETASCRAGASFISLKYHWFSRHTAAPLSAGK